jgi:signal transduction histidine kinase
LYTLVVLLLGMGSLSFYASETLRKDMEKLLGEQQLAKAAIMADLIENELLERQHALELLARNITSAMLSNHTAMQTLLSSRLLLRDLFGGGVIVLDAAGHPVAAIPGSQMNDFSAIQDARNAIKESARISGPHAYLPSGTAHFDISVPIHDEKNEKLGGLVGCIDLSKPNFLDRFGQLGNHSVVEFLLIDPRLRQIITASDKSRSLEQLPGPPHSSALVDRIMAGYEGTLVAGNTRGVEVMASAKSIPTTGWLIVTTIPTSLAFAPVHNMQQRMLLATLVLTLVTALLTWWLLHRQLEPMRAATRALARHANTNELFQPLPVVHKDEIGALITAFNHLLVCLNEREDALHETEAELQATLNAMRGLTDELEQQVQQRTDQLRSISAQLTLTEERERQLLAQELHDNLGQFLAAAKIRLDSLTPKSKTLQTQILSIAKLIEQAQQSVRQITQEWSPPLLNVLGFLPAIEWLVEDIRRFYAIEVSSRMMICKMPLREETQAFLFRSLRELLINVAKHAGVKSAAISMRCHAGKMICSVHDAGCSFDPAPVLHNPACRLSYGLRSINERIQTLGGTLHIDSQPGKGTTVTLTLPCDKLTEECTQP